MLEVRPFAYSWLKLNTCFLALPLPSSAIDFVSTPTSVDFPESTLPITATRVSLSGRTPMLESIESNFVWKSFVSLILSISSAISFCCWSVCFFFGTASLLSSRCAGVDVSILSRSSPAVVALGFSASEVCGCYSGLLVPKRCLCCC
jgi:hypothetical protein